MTCDSKINLYGFISKEINVILTVVSNHFHSVKFCYFRPPDHVISMELLALNFRCQCTQQKLQSICAVLTFDPQANKIKFVFFLYLRLSASSKENQLRFGHHYNENNITNRNKYVCTNVTMGWPMDASIFKLYAKGEIIIFPGN